VPPVSTRRPTGIFGVTIGQYGLKLSQCLGSCLAHCCSRERPEIDLYSSRRGLVERPPLVRVKDDVRQTHRTQVENSKIV
jgi:hypothetical protein